MMAVLFLHQIHFIVLDLRFILVMFKIFQKICFENYAFITIEIFSTLIEEASKKNF